MSDVTKLIDTAGLTYSGRMLVITNDGDVLNPEVNKHAMVTNIFEARKNMNLDKYWWNIIDKSKDNVTKAVEKGLNSGYFIKVDKGKMADAETCLVTSLSEFEQNTHNIIIAEENSKLGILTGCIADKSISSNVHNGVSEIYVGKNAEVTFTMVHSWTEDSEVYPRTAVRVEEGGTFISNYIILDPVKKVQSDPQIYLEGKNANAALKSFIYSHDKTNIDLGGTIYLNHSGDKGEVVTSAVMTGGRINSEGTLIGNSEDIRAHSSCDTMILSDNCEMIAVPKLVARKKDLDMTHEASIGKISKNQIEYLQTKGVPAEKAESMIVRGFIDESLGKLSDSLKSKVERLVESASQGM
jgi:Fe-S cluster assembly scaffold protein SufB